MVDVGVSDKELPLKRTLQAYVRDNGLSELVVFAGFRKDCWRLLSAADVYVLRLDGKAFRWYCSKQWHPNVPF